MISVLVVDQYEAVGKGTKLLLEEEHDFQVTFLSSSIEALEAISKQKFNVLLLDLDMPVIKGKEFVKKVSEVDSDVKMVIYTGYDIKPFVYSFIELGVLGFVSKTASKKQLIESIRSVLRGDAIIPVGFLEKLREFINYSDVKQLSQITKEDIKLLKAVALGKTNKEIANSLFLSKRAIEYRLTTLYKKLGVSSRMEAVEKARKIGLIGDAHR